MVQKNETLDPHACTKAVVNNTPHPDKFRGPDQLLKDLGILGDFEVEVHKAGIIKDIAALGFSIDGSDISSGPAVNVGDCSASVLGNAS
jgi:hypothetical protein